MEGRSKQSQAGAQEQGTARNKDAGGSRPQDAPGHRGFGRLRAPSVAIFCDWEAELASDPLFVFFLFYFIPLCAHTHTHTPQMHAYILRSSSAYATPLCGPLWFSRCCSWRWHLTPLAAAFSWDSITACLAKADWFFKDNIFWGGIFFFSLPPKKPFLLGRERHDL